MKALIIIIMGGVGDIRGAIVAALILGIVETTVARLIDPGLTLAAAYAIFVLVLLFGHRVCLEGSRHEPRLGYFVAGVGRGPSASGGLRAAGSQRILDVDCTDHRHVHGSGNQLGAVFGPTHYISLATAAFFGVGGYLVGTGMSDYNMDFWTMVCIAPIVGAVLAFLIGIATLRCRASTSSSSHSASPR